MDTTNSPCHDYPSQQQLHNMSFDPWRNSQHQSQSQVPSTTPPIIPPKPTSLTSHRNSSFNNNSNFFVQQPQLDLLAANGPYHRPILTMPPVILMGGGNGHSVPPSPIIEMPPSPAPNSMPIVEYPTDDEHEFRNSGHGHDRYFVEVRVWNFCYILFCCFSVCQNVVLFLGLDIDFYVSFVHFISLFLSSQQNQKIVHLF